jgi:hypothetical protein
VSSVDRLQDAAGVLPLLCLYEQSLKAAAFSEVFVLDLIGFWENAMRNSFDVEACKSYGL